jgi:hypothetical protein
MGKKQGALKFDSTKRPHVVVSTGAAPGYFAIRFGKWLGSRRST